MRKPTKYRMSDDEPHRDRIIKYPLPKLYPENIEDDLYMPDNDSVYVNINNEDTKKGN